MKPLKALEVLAVNLVLLAAALLVLQDEAWRASYAEGGGYSVSVVYSFLTHLFTMTGGGRVLTSPPTVDWLQLLALVAIAYDALLVYGLLRSRASPR